MNRAHRFVTLLAAATLAVAAGPSHAQRTVSDPTISVLATNAITRPLTAIAAEHERLTGQHVSLEFDTSPNINQRLADGTVNGIQLLIAARPTVDQALRDDQAIAGTRLHIGQVGIGVAVPRGAPRPDLSSVDAFRSTLRQADAVVFSRGASGVYVAEMLDALRLDLGTRAVQLETGADMLARIAASQGNEIGMTQISEIGAAPQRTDGAVAYAGPLPAALQHYTQFDGVAMTGASEAARAFLRSLTSGPSRALLEANAWEP